MGYFGILLGVFGVFLLADARELLLVHSIWRHGGRTPTLTYPADPLYGTNPYPIDPGQLTKTGMKQHFRLGGLLKKRYKDFISEFYDPKEVYCRTTAYDRTVMSALSNLAGMFQGRKNVTIPGLEDWPCLWRPVACYNIPATQDNIVHMNADCPSLREYFENEVFKSEDFRRFWDEQKDFIEEIQIKSGLTRNLDLVHFYHSGSCHGIVDAILVSKEYRLPVPEWVTEDIFHHMEYLSEWWFHHRFQEPVVTKMVGGGGSLIKDILERFEKKILCDKMLDCDSFVKHLKYYIYSSHDTTVTSYTAATEALDVRSKLLPGYTANVLVELWKEDDGSYSMQQFYKQYPHDDEWEPIKLYSCEAGTPCPIEQVKREAKDWMPEDWKKECSEKLKPVIPDSRLRCAQTKKVECVFPFQYLNKTYSDCTTDGAGDYCWCSKTSVFSDSWTRCDADCGSSKAPDDCKFPFTYKGNEYTSCTSENTDYCWCSEDQHYHGRWKRCSATICPACPAGPWGEDGPLGPTGCPGEPGEEGSPGLLLNAVTCACAPGQPGKSGKQGPDFCFSQCVKREGTESECFENSKKECLQWRAYMGTKAVTREGKECANWMQSGDYYVKESGGQSLPGFGDHNFCRVDLTNEAEAGTAPWCYHAKYDPNDNKVWDYCFRDCNPPEPCLENQAREDECYSQAPSCKGYGPYNGHKNVTVNGKPCQSWVGTKYLKQGLAGFGEHNLCRASGRQGKVHTFYQPWCYIDEKKRNWEFCFTDCEPKCLLNEGLPNECWEFGIKACKATERYQGDKAVTKNDAECKDWPRKYSKREGFGENNFCRATKNYHPWCYHKSKGGWEYCFLDCKDVPKIQCDMKDLSNFYKCLEEPLTGQNGLTIQDAGLLCFNQANCGVPDGGLLRQWEFTRTCRVNVFDQYIRPKLEECIKEQSFIIEVPDFTKAYNFLSYLDDCQMEGKCNGYLADSCGTDEGNIGKMRLCMKAQKDATDAKAFKYRSTCFSALTAKCKEFFIPARNLFCKCAYEKLKNANDIKNKFNKCEKDSGSKFPRPPSAGFMLYIDTFCNTAI